MLCFICKTEEANVAVKQNGNDKVIYPICYNDFLQNRGSVTPIKTLAGISLTVEDMMDS